jgi:hypothetical protein
VIEDFEGGRFISFHGLPVVHLPGGRIDDVEKWPGAPLPANVQNWAWRVGVESWDGVPYLTWFDLFQRDVDTTRVRAFIIGNWIQDATMQTPSREFFGPLIENAERYPALEALFVGDIEQEEHEISWIHQDDVTPLLTAFPRLRAFGVRGGTEGLVFEPFTHTELRELTVQAGGLAPETVRAIGASDLPALTDLELYLGTDEYGGGADAADLVEILSGVRLPSVRYLGLRDAENADEIAAAVAHAPIVAQLEVLDLSLGNLSDVGAAALMAGQPLTHLKKLDLHYHFMSEEMQERIREALPGVEVDLSGVQEPDEDGDEVYRYIAVSE